ncbi:hypothetical protein TWF506_002737 [Arthrobotrys conoides]|uniref:Uncharacterized protein n=1 Tax=Arthrobotrys conoides TaxID=74498 RepID=A0AAN8RQZ3_9PEZI
MGNWWAKPNSRLMDANASSGDQVKTRMKAIEKVRRKCKKMVLNFRLDARLADGLNDTLKWEEGLQSE